MGDGALMEFTSAVNAVVAAVELQAKMAEANYMAEYNEAVEPFIGKCGAAISASRSPSSPAEPSQASKQI